MCTEAVVPIAPKCNIGCNFCIRSINTEEDRPGVAGSIMDADAKRLVMLVPSEPEWNKLSSSWENSFHIPCRAGEGIQTNSRKFDEIASFIVR